MMMKLNYYIFSAIFLLFFSLSPTQACSPARFVAKLSLKDLNTKPVMYLSNNKKYKLVVSSGQWSKTRHGNFKLSTPPSLMVFKILSNGGLKKWWRYDLKVEKTFLRKGDTYRAFIDTKINALKYKKYHLSNNGNTIYSYIGEIRYADRDLQPVVWIFQKGKLVKELKHADFLSPKDIMNTCGTAGWLKSKKDYTAYDVKLIGNFLRLTTVDENKWVLGPNGHLRNDGVF